MAADCAATDFTGPVVSVLDGDAIEVLHAQATHDQIMFQIIFTLIARK